MADIKVSQLGETQTVSPDSTFLVIKSGASKKVTLSSLLSSLDSFGDININPTKNVINFTVFSKGGPLLKCNSEYNRIGINTDTPQTDLHVAGSTKVDGIVLNSVDFITHSPGTPLVGANISTLTDSTGISIYGNSTFELAPGIQGQTKNIFVNGYTAGATATITLNGLGFTTIVFQSTSGPPARTPYGMGVSLKYINSSWVLFGNNGAHLA